MKIYVTCVGGTYVAQAKTYRDGKLWSFGSGATVREAINALLDEINER